MSTLLIIIVALTVNLLPADVKEFSVESQKEQNCRFSKQKDGGWKVTTIPKGKTLGVFYVKGFMTTTTINGRECKIDTSRFLGVKSLDQIKDLKQIKNGSQEIKIERKESEILLHVKQKPIKINNTVVKLDRLIKISWNK